MDIQCHWPVSQFDMYRSQAARLQIVGSHLSISGTHDCWPDSLDLAKGGSTLETPAVNVGSCRPCIVQASMPFKMKPWEERASLWALSRKWGPVITLHWHKGAYGLFMVDGSSLKIKSLQSRKKILGSVFYINSVMFSEFREYATITTSKVSVYSSANFQTQIICRVLRNGLLFTLITTALHRKLRHCSPWVLPLGGLWRTPEEILYYF